MPAPTHTPLTKTSSHHACIDSRCSRRDELRETLRTIEASAAQIEVISIRRRSVGSALASLRQRKSSNFNGRGLFFALWARCRVARTETDPGAQVGEEASWTASCAAYLVCIARGG